LEQHEFVGYVHQPEYTDYDLGWVPLPVGHVVELLGDLRHEPRPHDHPQLSMAG